MKDLRLPRSHTFYKIIVYDPNVHKYYNKASDIYLSEDDISAYKLPDPNTLQGYKHETQQSLDNHRTNSP